MGTGPWSGDEVKPWRSSRPPDPRFGGTTSRFVTAPRGGPPAELFRVPQDYEITSTGGASSAPAGFGIATPGERVELRIVRPQGD
nr:hypothetical protein [Gammaproteobacteria bacterium]